MFSAYLATSYAYVVPPILGFFVLTALSLIAVVTGRKKRTNLLFAAICSMGALINADVALVNLIPDKDIALLVDRATYVFFVFSPPVYIQFVHRFLEMKNRRWLELIGYGMSGVFLLLVPTEHFIRGFHHFSFGIIAQAGNAFHVFSFVAGSTVCYCIYTLFRRMKETPSNQQKNRIKYIMGGLGLSSFLLALNILPVSGLDVYPMGNFSFIPAVVLGIGVLKYDLLDVGAVVRHGIVYFSLTIILTALYFIFISALNLVFFDREWNRTIVLPLLLAVLMVFLFNPIKTRIHYFIDRLFFRGKYDYRKVLRHVSGRLATLLTFDAIRQLVTESIADALEVTHIALLVREEEGGMYALRGRSGQDFPWPPVAIPADHALTAHLRANRRPLIDYNLEKMPLPESDREDVLSLFRQMRAALVIPMIARDALIGLIVLGQKKSGELFVHEDLELLSTLANQSAIAIDNAATYEALAQLNQMLEKKVETRTADLRQALLDKEKAQAQLIRSESLAAIGQLVAGTAHELNNPLASASSLVQISVETLREKECQEQNREELLDDLEFSLVELRRAGDIVKSLLSLSRQTQTYVEPVNMNTVMDDALRVLHNQLKNSKVAIVKHYDPDLPYIEGNFANLGQVLINIIKNALQALSDGKGEITLSSSHCSGQNTVVVECRDTGGGISAVHMKDIFKPFFTTKAVGRGTGLGLYICHEIVSRHGGSITATSRPGAGSNFKIELPQKRRES